MTKNRILANPKMYAIMLLGRILPNTIEADAFYLKLLYKNRMKKTLNLNNPQTYNEKLQWIKLYDRKPEYTELVDKAMVKAKVGKIIGNQYIIPTLGIWDSFKEIDFSKLPDQFVLKCTHDSGGLVVCKDKNNLDWLNAEKKIAHCLRRNYYLNTREWPYKNVPHKIIAEQFISQKDGGLPVDYKFFCFGGEPDCVMLCVGREYGHPQFFFYSMEWKRLLYQKTEIEPDADIEIEQPKNFSEMIDVVRKLAEGYPEIRIDLYNVDGKIYFGEYTFFNQSGFDVEISEKTDLYWGNKLHLPMKH